jgi:HlyD family secretion protein
VGYSADIEVVIAARDNVLRVPTTAIQPGGRVLVLAGEALEERTVDTGLSNWEFTEVRSGLQRGERVVTSLERPGVRAGARAREESKAGAAGK